MEKLKQWYKLDPSRFREEQSLIQHQFPEFTMEYRTKGNVFWRGKSIFIGADERVLYTLDIEVECLPEYPKVFPKVLDVENILKEKGCPHLFTDGSVTNRTICYGNRLDPQLNFFKETRLKDVIIQVGIFLGYQWYFERDGKWPHEHQGHYIDTFIEHEKAGNIIELNELCPCGLSPISYKKCCYNKVQEKKGQSKFERNGRCFCGSGLKYKKCCGK